MLGCCRLPVIGGDSHAICAEMSRKVKQTYRLCKKDAQKNSPADVHALDTSGQALFGVRYAVSEERYHVGDEIQTNIDGMKLAAHLHVVQLFESR